MFAYPCPSCRQRLLAPSSRVGQRSICPKCLHPLTVPAPEQVAAGGPFAPTAPEPSPGELFQPADAGGPPAEFEVDTPIPMNTMPSRTGEFSEMDRNATATEPFLDLEPVLAEATPTEVEAVALALPSTAPKPLRPLTRPARRTTSEHDGRVAFDPTALFGGDAVAQLSAAISMRMAPPPLPATDRIYAAIGWVVGTLVGLGVWVLAVWQSANWLPYVALIGAAMTALGLLWRAYLCGRNGSWVSGLLTLLPPVCLVQLVRPAAGVGLRPLWFVLSGLGLFGLFIVGTPTKKWVDDKFDGPSTGLTTTTPAADLDTTAGRLETKAEREEAKAALVKAGATAEPAVRKLLTAKGDGTVIAACDVLEQIGTADTVPVLRKLADDTPSRAVRIEAASAADAIEKRLKK